MTNWKVFEITSKNNNSGWIRFRLDGYVRYSDESEKYIDCNDSYPYNDWEEGDDIKIDVDRTCYYDSNKTFDDTNIVKKVSSSNSMALVRTQANYSALQSSYNYLQSSNSQLESRSSSLQSENSGLQNLIRVGERELANKNNQISEKDRQITTYSTQLTASQNQVQEKEGQLTLSREEAKRATDLFNNLQITVNNKDNELENKQKELEKRERKIKELEGLLGKSKGEIIKHKLEVKEGKLEEFIQQLGVNRVRVRELRNAYQQLIRAQENYNQDNITEVDDKIETIKDEFLDGGVSVANN